MYRIYNKDDDSDNGSTESDGIRFESEDFENAFKNAFLAFDGKKTALPPARVPSPSENKLPESGILFNSRALPKESITYELEKFEKNYMVIIIQEQVDNFEEILDTQEDVNVLKETFAKFNFEIMELKDKTKKEIFTALDIFNNKDFTDYGCVAVVVLTRGDLIDHEIWAKDEKYNEDDIVNYFKVDSEKKSTLVTKPKILIIQACSLVEIQTVPVIKKDALEAMDPYTSPDTADILVVYSAYVKKQSDGENVGGPWFIQTFCKEVDVVAGSKHVENILSSIRREVAMNFLGEEYPDDRGKINRYRLTPKLMSTLYRELYFREFRYSPQITSKFAEDPITPSFPAGDPWTPLLAQCEHCQCFPDHYSYIRNCLNYFVQENPDDEIAKGFLNISNQFGDEVMFNRAKETMRIAICQHLVSNADRCSFYKHIYFYGFTKH